MRCICSVWVAKVRSCSCVVSRFFVLVYVKCVMRFLMLMVWWCLWRVASMLLRLLFEMLRCFMLLLI